MLKLVLRILEVAFLMAWVIPGWLGYSLYRKGVELTEAGTRNMHSFPFESYGQQLMVLAAIWFAISAAILVYKVISFSRHAQKPRKN